MAGIQGVEEVKEKRSKGCRNPRSGDPRGSRNPRGAGAQKWQKLKGWSFACRARVSPFFAQASSFSERAWVFSEQVFLSPRDPGFSPRELCLPREFRISRADFAFPSVILPFFAQASSFSERAESHPARFPPHAGFLCFFGAFIAEFYIFYFYE